jgi:hypothetical protein
MNQKQTLALNCLLAEQVSSQERLLWRMCPDPGHSSAARARSLLTRSASYYIALGSLIIVGLFIAGAVFSSVPQDSSGDQAASLFGVLILLCAGLLMYLYFKRPRWLHHLKANPFGSSASFAVPQGRTALVEPPPVPILRGRQIYGLTDQRVIILEVGKHRSVRSLWLHDLEEVQCMDAGDGWGDLVLLGALSSVPTRSSWPDISMQRPVTRLWGIERVRHVEEALRCLLTHKPLKAAMDALTFQADIPNAVRMQGGDVLSAASRIRAQQWQALLWCGPTVKELKGTIVYGSDLVQLRARAAAWLLSQRPRYFCNTSYPPANEHLASRGLYGLYSCSELPSHQPMMAASILERDMDREDSDGPSRGRRRYHGKKGASTESEVDSSRSEAQPAQDEQHAPAQEHASHPQEAEKMQPCQWIRESLIPGPGRNTRYLDFPCFEDAVTHFVNCDVLSERGPTYIDESRVQEQQLRHMQTVKVVDGDLAANDLLHRGGWHVFQTMGMTAPRGQMGPVLFVLGHPEDQAI